MTATEAAIAATTGGAAGAGPTAATGTTEKSGSTEKSDEGPSDYDEENSNSRFHPCNIDVGRKANYISECIFICVPYLLLVVATRYLTVASHSDLHK